MLYEAVVNLIGPVPVGYEPLVYCLSFLVFLWVLSSTFSILWSIVNWLGGK